MSTPPQDPAALSRTLRTLWGAIAGGGAMILVVMGGLAVSQAAPLADAGPLVFFGVAALSLAGLASALAVMRTLENRERRTPAEVMQRAIVAVAGVDATAIAAAVATFLTGDVLTLAFGVPLFAFVAVFWPSETRVERWLGSE